MFEYSKPVAEGQNDKPAGALRAQDGALVVARLIPAAVILS